MAHSVAESVDCAARRVRVHRVPVSGLLHGGPSWRFVELLRRVALGIAMSDDLERAVTKTLRALCDETGWIAGSSWTAPAGNVNRAGGRRSVELIKGPEWISSAANEFGPCCGKCDPDVAASVFRRKRAVWLECDRHVKMCTKLHGASSAARDVTGKLGVPVFAGDEVVCAMVFLAAPHQRHDPRLAELIEAAVAPLGFLIKHRQYEERLRHHGEELEAAVAARTRELEQTHEALRVAERMVSIGTLAAGLGHDMHNVLLPVRCRLDVLEAQSPEPLREHLAAVRRSVEYLQRLSDGLHMLALNPDDGDATGTVTDIAGWWQDVSVLLAGAVRHPGRLEASIEGGLPQARIAPHRLTQAVLNLVVNAGEALDPERGGRVSVHAGASPRRGWVELSVIDDGCGMDAATRLHALEPFFTTKKRGIGTGLGLPMVHAVVSAAGGTVRIRSAPGKGTTATLRIPAVLKRTEGAATAARPVATVGLTDSGRGAMLGGFLSAAGYDVNNRPGAVADSDVSIWVTEPGQGRLDSAREFLRSGGRRSVIVVGEASAEWELSGVVRLNNVDSFEHIKRAVEEASFAAEGSRA